MGSWAILIAQSPYEKECGGRGQILIWPQCDTVGAGSIMGPEVGSHPLAPLLN